MKRRGTGTAGRGGSRESGDQGEETAHMWMVVSEVRTRLELEPM